MIDSSKARILSDKINKNKNIKNIKIKKIKFSKIKNIINKIPYEIKQYKLYKEDIKNVKIAISEQIIKGNGIGYARVILQNKEKTIPLLKKLGYDVTEMKSYQGYPMIDIRW